MVDLVDWKTNVCFLQHGRSVCRNQGVDETQTCLIRQKGVDRKLDKFTADGVIHDDGFLPCDTTDDIFLLAKMKLKTFFAA